MKLNQIANDERSGLSPSQTENSVISALTNKLEEINLRVGRLQEASSVTARKTEKSVKVLDKAKKMGWGSVIPRCRRKRCINGVDHTHHIPPLSDDRRIVCMAVTDRAAPPRTRVQQIQSVQHHSVPVHTIPRHLQ
ncbi:hypothetical protein TNCV_1055901 [Trichonephila clavipes]|nr:hypothetical protein TNCV_1055901 [Trichonephila clavipes]